MRSWNSSLTGLSRTLRPIKKAKDKMRILDIPMSELKTGDNLVNLGKVLEIEKQDTTYSVVIQRMNQKQVFKFLGSQILYIHQENVA